MFLNLHKHDLEVLFCIYIFKQESKMGKDGCMTSTEGGDCWLKSSMVDHTDYIYTQDIDGPW